MKQTIKYLITGSLLLTLNACVQFRNPEAEEEGTPEVQIQNLEDATIQGEMYLYTGQIMSKEDYQAALIKDLKEGQPTKDTQDVELKFERLNFEEGSVLYTMGKKVRLSAKILEGDQGARIATFPADQVADKGVDGRAGGHIVLAVEKAWGTLTIELRGEKGGEGRKGPEPTPDMKGADGADALKHHMKQEGTGGTSLVCASDADAMGQPGQPGKQGGVGQRGGDTGTLDLQLVDAKDLKYTVSQIPGAGGIGGVGGDGGEGGIGGIVRQCTKREPQHRAPTAATGKSGDQGPTGADGQLQTYCVTIQGTMTCSN